MSDSSSDEYRADDNRAAGTFWEPTTLCWTELLVRYRDFDLGTWGSRPEPRRSGYLYNWARSGAEAADVISAGQHTGIAAQVQAGAVDIVYFQIGNNDFAYYRDGADIYNGSLSGQPLTNKIDAYIGNVTTALDTVLAADPNIKVILGNIADPGLSPYWMSQFPDPARRQLVTDAINQANAGIANLAATRSRVILFDQLVFATQLLSNLVDGNLVISGENISLVANGDEPHHAVLADNIHGGTVLEGLFANGVIEFINQALGAQVQPFSELELITHAGIVSEPTPTSTLTSTATATDTASPTVTLTPTTTDLPTATESPTPTASETASFTATITPTPTDTGTPTTTLTPTATPVETPTATLTPTDTPTPTEIPTPTLTPTATETPTSTITPTPTGTPTPTQTLASTPTQPAVGSSEWSQLAHDYLHTSYTDQMVPTPWRWKWSWNGPDASGGVRTDKINYPGSTNFTTPGLPRNVQPVTGGGKVYIAAGNFGIYALNEIDTNADSFADVVWNVNPVASGGFYSTPAYDHDTGALFALGTNGILYKLNSADGAVIDQFATNQSYATYVTSASYYNKHVSLPASPTLVGNRLFISMGQKVFALDKYNLNSVLWVYNAEAEVYTPPAYSPQKDLVLVASQDLTPGGDGKLHIYVHAISNASGGQIWKTSLTNITGLQAGDPNPPPGFTSVSRAEVINGWPVIAEEHGLVLIKLRLNWNSMWTWSPWSTSNATNQSRLASNPNQQALIVLSMETGAQPFIANVGHGGFGDGFIPMGPQPVVKKFPDGSEVVYTMIRGNSGTDGRGDSHFGEMVLDNWTIPGLEPGYVRWIEYCNYGWSTNGNCYPPPTDEQANITVSGNQLFGGHWMMGNAMEIIDRSSSYGSYANPIITNPIPNIALMTNSTAVSSGYNPSHYVPNNFAVATSGEWRAIPPGFYIYWNQGHLYDTYWSDYAVWVVSNGTIYFRSVDGAIVALEHAAAGPTPTPGPTNTPTPTSPPTSTPSPTTSPTPLSPDTRFLLSISSDGVVNGLSAAGEDILVFSPATSQYQMYFDGSDVGLASSALGAFTRLASGEIIFSTTTSLTLPGSLSVTPQDLVRFVPSSTGSDTSGTFSMYFDGSDVGLTTTSENIDAVAVLPNGNVLISTTGSVTVTGISATDEDVLEFIPTSLGSVTAGSWAWFIDGSDIGLTDTVEDTDSLFIDPSGKIYLSTLGNFSVTGVSGQGSDAVLFNPSQTGSTTTGTYTAPVFFDGDAFGLSGFNLSSFWFGIMD